MEAEELHEKVSVAKAKRFFETHVVPRRVRDFRAEEVYEQLHGKKKIIFRRVAPDEQHAGLGEPFPVLTAGLRTFAAFGKGVGVYFLQLLFLAAVSLCAAMAMMVAVRAYVETRTEEATRGDGFLSMTAVCAPFALVNATQGCPNGLSLCAVEYRAQCTLPERAVYADLAMSVLFTASLALSKLFDREMKRDLDEAVQTAQDYALCVADPPGDAQDADEWYEFFNRWGAVRYVSVVRDNAALLDCAVAVHELTTKKKELERHFAVRFGAIEGRGRESEKESKRDRQREKEREIKLIARTERQLNREKARLGELARARYAACKVFVVFELETQQRLCLASLEVADYRAVLDVADRSLARSLFRGKEVLNVLEAPEPDNVLWRNQRPLSLWERQTRVALSWAGALGWLVLCWYMIKAAKSVSPTLLAFVIGVLDVCQTSLFHTLTALTLPASQSHFQNALQMKLFFARLLFSTILPFSQAPWQSMLDEEYIRQICVIQATSCFVAPLLALCDPVGWAMRRVVGPLIADTQSELNALWTGYNWSLAERYTGISKVLFVSLFYALLTPFSIFLAFLAFAVMFFVDRFLLLRKWKAQSMLDAEVSSRLRQQAVLAVAAHLYASCRFVYSWPMDAAFRDPISGETERVSKFPSLSPFHWSHTERWQSVSQQRLLYHCKIVFFLVAALTLLSWCIVPLHHKLRAWFCYVFKTEGDAQQVPFSRIDAHISVYEPVWEKDSRKYLCSYTQEMLAEHRPPLLPPQGPRTESEHEALAVDLSAYIPAEQQRHVLSIVKYYGDDLAELGRAPALSAASALEREQEALREKERLSLGGRAYTIATTREGVVARVPPNTHAEIPADLLAIITPRVVTLTLGEDVSLSKETAPQRESQEKKEEGAQSKKISAAQRARRPAKTAARVEEERVVLEGPRRQFTAKPLYRQLYGLSSSSSSGESSEGEQGSAVDVEEDYYLRKSRNVKSTARKSAPPAETAISTHKSNVTAKSDENPPPRDLVKSVSFAAPKRSDSPPRSNYRKR